METIDLRNKHKNKIIDIIGSYVPSRHALKENRAKIIKLLNETIEVNESQLTQPIQFLKEVLPKEAFAVSSLQEFRTRCFQFMQYILSIPQDKMSDGGYSLLISYYFYISEQLI